MSTTSPVACYLAERIRASGRTQAEIARDAGFRSANMITMLKQGRTRLPLDKVGPLASALDCDPTHLLKLCLQEYCPQTWVRTGPLFDSMLTRDEAALLGAMRRHVGAPYLVALAEEPRQHLERLLASLRDRQAAIQ